MENMITGKVAKAPGDVKTINAEKGSTVGTVIGLAGWTYGEGMTVKVNGVRVGGAAINETTVDEDNFTVLITGNVRGN